MGSDHSGGALSFESWPKYDEKMAKEKPIYRNPWAWVFSHYQWQGKGRSLIQYLKDKINNSKSDYHGHVLWPQMSWFKDKENNVRADFIGRFEHIEEDFKFIANRLNLHNARLPHLNMAIYDKDYRKYYDDESRQIVADYHHDDIAKFDYSF